MWEVDQEDRSSVEGFGVGGRWAPDRVMVVESFWNLETSLLWPRRYLRNDGGGKTTIGHEGGETSD